MTAAWILLVSSVLGQVNPYYPSGFTVGYGNTYGPGYGYYARTPLPAFDPMRYNRFYSGEGFYNFQPPVIANPEVINLRRSDTATSASPAALTGRVVAVDEAKKQITVQLPAGQVIVPYGPTTHFVAADGNLPVIKPGNLISVNQNTITILRRG
jgi:hypothetical protein